MSEGVHMNKLTLILQAAVYHFKGHVGSLSQRVWSGHVGRPNVQSCRPQWQQLELPLSRTPVKRWNR